MKNAPLPTLNEIIFENRNKEYGAYDLRINYNKNLSKGFIVTLVFMFVSFSLLWFFRKNVETIMRPITKTVIIELDKFTTKIEEIKLQKVAIKSIGFVPPIIVANDIPETYVVPKTDELKNAVIGSSTIEGSEFDGLIEPEVGKENIIEEKIFETSKPKIEEDNSIFSTAEIMPEFQGGLREFIKYLQKNVNYPNAAMRSGIEGKVFIQFVVSKTGKISDVVVLKGIGFGCDEEALRVISNMPNWSPGLQNNRPVNVKYTIPVSFKLE